MAKQSMDVPKEWETKARAIEEMDDTCALMTETNARPIAKHNAPRLRSGPKEVLFRGFALNSSLSENEKITHFNKSLFLFVVFVLAYCAGIKQIFVFLKSASFV